MRTWRASGGGLPLLASRTVAMLPFFLGAALLITSCKKAPAPYQPERPFEVVVHAPTNQVAVGDVVEVRMDVYHPIDTQVQAPELDRGKAIEVRNRDWQADLLNDETLHTRIVYELASFEVGEHLLSSGAVKCVMADGSVLEEAFPEHHLDVRSVLDHPDAPLKDIKDPKSIPARVPRWAWAVPLAILLAVLLAVVVTRMVRRRVHEAPPVPRIPPHEVAMDALRRLKEKGYIENNHAEPFYVELSHIVRVYLEDRFQLHAPEMTTEEFIRETSQSHILQPEHQQLTSDFLAQSDLVKFAKFIPAAASMQDAFQAAERLVEETKFGEAAA